MDDIQNLLDQKDISGLGRVLRDGTDPFRRVQASDALGRLGELKGAEFLIQSALYDPDPLVRQSSDRNLRLLLGSQADWVLGLEREMTPENESWLESPSGLVNTGEDYDMYEVGAPFSQPENRSGIQIDGSEIRGLATLAGHSASSKSVRLKAVRALAESHDINAIQLLGQIALWEEDDEIRKAAHDTLEQTLGDGLPDFLDSIQMIGEDDEENEDAIQPRNPGIEYPSVTQEEHTPLWLGVLLGLLFFVLTWILFFR